MAINPRIVIREAVDDDARFLAAGFERLSDDSKYLRFFSAMPTLPDSLLDQLSTIDGVRSAAVVALDAADGPECPPVGVARWSSDRNGMAHLGVVVLDDHQGQGIGRMLLDELFALAASRGIRVMHADVLAVNHPMKHLLAGYPVRVVPTDDASVTSYEIDLT